MYLFFRFFGSLDQLLILVSFALETDPEEIRKAQEEMRNQGVPSIANLIPGAARSN